MISIYDLSLSTRKLGSHIGYDIILIDSYVTLPVSVFFLTALPIPHTTYLHTVPLSYFLAIVV
jgi:hypothetical protein